MQVLEVNRIRKEFGTLVAVNDVSFTLESGQVLGLIGPNGAGKTTLLRILATVLRPTSGSVQLLGYDLKSQYLDIRKHLGYLPDFFNLYNDLTLRECLEFFAKAYKVQEDLIPQRIDDVLNYVELEYKRNDFISHLSRGMVQRMGVGVLLVHEPDVFLLDEPASGLDPKARIQLRKVLKKLSTEGKTIIISSHILTELSGFCTHIAIMNEGNIVMHGAVDDIRQKVFNTRRINISVLEGAEQAASVIKQFPGANILSAQDNHITVDINATDAELAQLNAHIVSKGIELYSFCEQKTDLEDLFMRISGDEQDAQQQEI